jgi:uncharacterized repeat protein (TIGR01451 family)
MSRTATVILTAVITAAVTSLLWLAVGGVAFMIWKDTSDISFGDTSLLGEPFQVEFDAPSTVKAGETFTLSITATNIGDDKTTLNSIDIYDELSDGFEVVRISPSSSEKMDLFNFRSYYFEGLGLDAGESTTVSFELKAVKPGNWIGDVDCCTPSESFSSSTVAIEVTK